MSPSARLQKNSVSSQLVRSSSALCMCHAGGVNSIRVRKPRGVPGGTFIFRAQIEKLLPSFLRKIAEK